MTRKMQQRYFSSRGGGKVTSGLCGLRVQGEICAPCYDEVGIRLVS